MLTFAKALAGVCTSGAAVGAWTYNQASHLDPEQKGSFFARIKETFEAAIYTPSAPSHHTHLVASMSGKRDLFHAQSSDDLARVTREIYSMTDTYGKDYLVDRTWDGSQYPQVFTQTDDSTFRYGGSTNDIFDSLARQAILDKEYTRCPPILLEGQEDIIITGTVDPKVCATFKSDLFRDVIALSVSAQDQYKLNGYSCEGCLRTLVYEEEEEGVYTPVVYLSGLLKHDQYKAAPRITRALQQGHFTACDNVHPEMVYDKALIIGACPEEEQPSRCKELYDQLKSQGNR